MKTTTSNYEAIKIYHDDLVLNTYKNWLLNKVDSIKYYYAKRLIHYPFYALIEPDQNRIGDATRLRDEFNNLTSNELYERDKTITILEVLVAFAIRIDNEWLDIGPKIIFKEMVKNLFSNKENETIKEICEKFVYREYDQNGFGGLFPLSSPTEDQRNVELWRQCMAYIKENKERLIT